MKRFAIRLVLFLLLGAIVNVAIAWGCAAWRPIEWHHRTARGYTHSQWPCWSLDVYRSPTGRYCSGKPILSGKDIPGVKGHEPDSVWGALSEESSISHQHVITGFPHHFTTPPSIDSPAYSRFVLIERGFPLPAFRCFATYAYADWWSEYYGVPLDATGRVIRGGFGPFLPPDLRERVVNEAIIPTQPIWFGLILNTLVYGLLCAFVYWFVRLATTTIREWSSSRVLWATLVLVILGVLSTIATAWISAAVHRVDWVAGHENRWDMARALDGDAYSEWYVLVFREPTAIGIQSRWWTDYHTGNRKPRIHPEALLPSWAGFAQPLVNHKIDEEVWFVDGRGWPLIAMFSAYKAKSDSNRTPFWLDGIAELRWGIELSPHDTSTQYRQDVYPLNARILPLGVNFVGFLINAVVYTAGYFVGIIAIASPWTIRRQRRRRRGRCIHCGYDLRGHTPGAGATPEAGHSPKCPECGL